MFIISTSKADWEQPPYGARLRPAKKKGEYRILPVSGDAYKVTSDGNWVRAEHKDQ